MIVYLIRHAETAGNRLRRYIGTTDEPITEAGAAVLARCRTEGVRRVFVSPMRRCLQTAERLFPDLRPTVVSDLRECDFGDFEGKNYLELDGNAAYQQWIDSGGTAAFPNGENPADFRARSVRAFREAVSGLGKEETAAFVVHNGTIMSVLASEAAEPREYFDWSVPNGNGYVCHSREDGTWEVLGKLW